MKPYIISASRREDIPAFRTNWLLNVLEFGHVDMTNMYSNYVISFENVKLMVFWTKNPFPLIKHLDEFPFDFYFQYTLNDYPEFELNVPSLEQRINTFKCLSKKIGKEKVIWRFDPCIINNQITEEELLKRIKFIGDQLYNYTEKLVFSYIDPYNKLNNEFTEIPIDSKIQIAKQLIEFNKNWNLKLATCAEGINLDRIEHNKCIDPELVKRICGNQSWIENKKDKGQRPLCGCIPSGDIGSFRKCKHQCSYCYAK